MTHEEAEAFKEEVVRRIRSKSNFAEMAAANLSGNGMLDRQGKREK